MAEVTAALNGKYCLCMACECRTWIVSYCTVDEFVMRCWDGLKRNGWVLETIKMLISYENFNLMENMIFLFFSENRGKINWTLEDTPFDCNEFKCHWIACGRRENVGKIQKFISMLFISSKVQLHFYSFFSIFFSIRFMFRVLCLAGFRVQCALCAAWKMIYCVLGKCIVSWLAGFGWLFVGFKAMENKKTENSILFRLENYLHNSFNFCFSLF